MLDILSAALRGITEDFTAAADAAARINKTPTIELTVAPSDAALNDAIRRGRLNRSLDALKGKK